MNKEKIKVLFALHILLLVYSLSGICSKLAAAEKFLSFKYCLFYGFEIVILGIYAVVWQQIIKRLPLTTAYANKAVTIIWGLIWGALIFAEQITIGKVIGALIVIVGVVMYVTAPEE